MSDQKLSVPKFPSLDEYSIPLAQMAAKTGYLPDPRTVAAFGGAVFPTVRKNKQICEPIERCGVVVGMYDDNTTPRWALLWAHGIPQTHHPKGWTFAHVWPSRDDLNSYTHLANLAMIPEAFGTLTDKEGPLTKFLQWHAWQKYGWKPEKEQTPTKPDGYDKIAWAYFPGIADPSSFILQRVAALNNKRIKTLRPLMERTCPE